MALKNYWQFVANQKSLEKALQDLHRAEKDGTIKDPKVRGQIFGRNKGRSKNEAKEVERAVERFIRSEKRYQKKIKHLSVGTY
ncbi:MAG TPA: hypothetical protein VFT82_04355 [Candidatus Paceibacterota bacterium]|nr:hypothetical protein [Candidatus Paceibacterota bacterium]